VQRYGRPGAQGLGPELRDRIADAALARRRRRPLLRWCAPRLVAAGLGALLAGAGWYGADRLSARGRGEARVGFDGPFAAYLDAAQAGSSPTHLAALRQLERSPAGRILALTRDAGHALDRGNRNSTPHRGRSK
jgi:hypothetical protein